MFEESDYGLESVYYTFTSDFGQFKHESDGIMVE